MDESSSRIPDERTYEAAIKQEYGSQENTNQRHIYNSYYGQNNSSNPTQDNLHDSQYDGQYVDQIEQHRELQYQQQIQREISQLNHEMNQLQPSNFEGRAFPNMILSLAQKLLPAVVQRLNHHDRLQGHEWMDSNEEFKGLCAPLGNSLEIAPAPADGAANLKTTGLEDENIKQYQIQPRRVSDLEMGDPMEYLPESAALLITAISAEKDSKRGSNVSLANLPSLLDEALKDDTDTEGRAFDLFEKEAEALLQSIQNEESQLAASTNITNTQDVPPSFDDDDSIGGDMARLSHSIAFLQQDLENVDSSHLDQLYGDDLDELDREGSAWSRMKLWFSRGMIMEQKLLNTMSGIDGNNYDDNARRSQYADNPVLIWSVAIMWAFILLIIGHAKIAEWVEGEDPGKLADVIEWMFS